MTDTPKTRSELVELMGQFLEKWSDWERTPSWERERAINSATEMIDALESHGVRLVPEELTDEMIFAAAVDMDKTRKLLGRIQFNTIWSSELSASPFAPKDSPDE